MKKFLNGSGSTWRKWDLHVHSPASKLHNEFTNWKEYFEALEKLSDIKVLGITDYYSIEGYLKVCDYKENGGLKNIDLILPNVEMRMDTVTSKDRPINFHIIFSPEVVPYIEDKFFRELKYKIGDRTFSCTTSDLVELGRLSKGDTTISNEAAHKEGMNQFKVSIDGIKDVLKQNEQIFRGKYITIVANKSNDGVSGLKNSSMLIEKSKIYQFADCVFSSRPKDREFFLGEAENHPKEEIIKQYGSLKPCIHGSDAHKIEKIGKPDENRFTWIKADPTFEGLLQIIQEPGKRVIIQEDHPDLKSDYNVIESVCFKDNPDFPSNEIKLNPGLNTIIGGKSSGKSLLLYKIAQSVSKDEIQYRANKEHWKNNYQSSFIEDINFEVIWRNGDISTPLNNRGMITYIPQMYINSLSEDTANKELQKLIKSILSQTDENATFIADSTEKIDKYTNDIKFDITRLFKKLEELHISNEVIKNKGNKDAIKKEKEKLLELIEKKLATSSLNKEDENEINRLEKEKKALLALLQELDNNYSAFINISKELNNVLDFINSNLKDLSPKQHDDIQEILDELRIQVNSSFLNAQSKIEEKRQEIERTKTINSEREKKVTEQLKPYFEKLQGKTEIAKLKENLQVQESLLNEITIEEKKQTGIISSLKTIRNGIFTTFENYYDTLKETKEFFSDQPSLPNLTLKASIDFDSIKFEDNFLALFNRRGKTSSLFSDNEEIKYFDEDGNFLFEEENFINKIRVLYDYLIDTETEKLKLRKSFTKQQAVEHLLDTSYTRIVFDLEKDGDRLSQMSPGKRGLILIELFLEMSNDKQPILIDQPEDNLDNRTISKDLVEILRNKKEERQIIIVTHNANLVVLTDSENVIIANQDKQLRENNAYRFEYLSGALECDFNEEGNKKLVSKGIRSHVCEILEGGKEAFEIRERKYGFN